MAVDVRNIPIEYALLGGVILTSRIATSVGGALYGGHEVPMTTAVALGVFETTLDLHNAALCYYVGRITKLNESNPIAPQMMFAVLYLLTSKVSTYLFKEMGYSLPDGYLADCYKASRLFSITAELLVTCYKCYSDYR